MALIRNLSLSGEIFLDGMHRKITATPYHLTYFEQFDWPEKTFFTSINPMSSNLGTIFLRLAPKICNNVVTNKRSTTTLE